MVFEKHKLLVAQVRAPQDDVSRRRDRMLMQIDKQIESVATDKIGAKRRGAWYRRIANGTYVLTIRYGRRDLELAKGKHAIGCDEVHEIIRALEEARAAVASGIFDNQMKAISNEIRAKFRKAAAED